MIIIRSNSSLCLDASPQCKKTMYSTACILMCILISYHNICMYCRRQAMALRLQRVWRGHRVRRPYRHIINNYHRRSVA